MRWRWMTERRSRFRRPNGRELLFTLGLVALASQIAIGAIEGPKRVSPEVMTAGTAVLLTPWVVGQGDKKREREDE